MKNKYWLTVVVITVVLLVVFVFFRNQSITNPWASPEIKNEAVEGYEGP